jgi:hypothetical protein
MRIVVAFLLLAIASSRTVSAQSVADDCARQAQDYANLTAPKSGGKVVRNSVNGVIVPGPVRDTTQLARGRDGSTVSGFARVDQYAPNREAQWIGQERCQLQRR